MSEDVAPGSIAELACRRDAPFVLALFAIGVIVNMVFSRMGFMPLDHSIVFDGGWRILGGQVPWRDFVAPSGVVPSAMQAVFFAVLGTNWYAYCLHASVINGLFAVLAYWLLATLRLPRPLAFFYGLCATYFFYPPVGVPFMEQHSFFFTLAAITSAVAGNHARGAGVQRLLWGIVPFLGLLAFLSKQVPFAFAALSLPAILLVPGAAPIRTRLLAVSAGAAACGAACLVLFVAFGIDWATFVEYTFVRPGATGAARAGAIGELAAKVARRYTNLPEALGLTFVGHAILFYRACLIAFPLMLLIWLRKRQVQPALTGDVVRLCTALLLAPVTYVSSMLLGFTTNNQTQNSIAFYPVAAGLVHAALCAELRVLEAGLSGFPNRAGAPPGRLAEAAGLWCRKAWRWIRGIETRPPGMVPRTVTLRSVMVVLLVGLSADPVRHWTTDTITFASDIDTTRFVNDMSFDAALAARSRNRLPPGMEFLRWTPSPPDYDLDAWTGLVVFLRTQNKNFLLIGDTLVTYGLAGRRSIPSNLWFHPGLTLPDVSEPAFDVYQADLIARAERHDVRFVVVEERRRMGLALDQLPRVSAWLAESWCETRAFGVNRVFERCR
jgi:hypothetical protein